MHFRYISKGISALENFSDAAILARRSNHASFRSFLQSSGLERYLYYPGPGQLQRRVDEFYQLQVRISQLKIELERRNETMAEMSEAAAMTRADTESHETELARLSSLVQQESTVKIIEEMVRMEMVDPEWTEILTLARESLSQGDAYQATQTKQTVRLRDLNASVPTVQLNLGNAVSARDSIKTAIREAEQERDGILDQIIMSVNVTGPSECGAKNLRFSSRLTQHIVEQKVIYIRKILGQRTSDLDAQILQTKGEREIVAIMEQELAKEKSNRIENEKRAETLRGYYQGLITDTSQSPAFRKTLEACEAQLNVYQRRIANTRDLATIESQIELCRARILELVEKEHFLSTEVAKIKADKKTILEETQQAVKDWVSEILLTTSRPTLDESMTVTPDSVEMEMPAARISPKRMSESADHVSNKRIRTKKDQAESVNLKSGNVELFIADEQGGTKPAFLPTPFLYLLNPNALYHRDKKSGLELFNQEISKPEFDPDIPITEVVERGKGSKTRSVSYRRLMATEQPTLVCHGATMLHCIAELSDMTPEQEKMAELLIEKGARTDIRRQDGYTAMDLAIIGGKRNLVAIFLRDPNAMTQIAPNGWTPLHRAAVSESVSVWADLLSWAFDNNPSLIGQLDTSEGPNDVRHTPIHCAIEAGNSEHLDVYIQRQSELELRNSAGMTLLTTALYEKKPEIAALLLRRGASLKTKDSDGSTPLHYAVSSRMPSQVKIVLEYADIADLTEPDGDGKSAAKLITTLQIDQVFTRRQAQEMESMINSRWNKLACHVSK